MLTEWRTKFGKGNMLKAVAEQVESAKSLLEAVGNPSEITLLRSWGNRGDDLIYAGTRRLLRDYLYRERDIRELSQVPGGETAIITGGGAWCKPFHRIAELLPAVEAKFSRVIVFPSSFDTEEAIVREVLSRTGAVVFARELESYEQIRHLCDARLAHDTAFFFDFASYQSGFHHGVLNAFRRDAEATGEPTPEENRDISSDCETVDEWLWTISKHDLIRTDRAHVVIAAAMLGKEVEWRSSSYHKVPGIVKFSISSSQVKAMGEWTRDVDGSLAEREGETTALSRCKCQLAEKAAAVERLSRSLNACEVELSRTAAELQVSRDVADALRGSLSWRLTAPLRALGDRVPFLRRLLLENKR
jgi:exopolysaccharide biosynthesis predicted pyruvyltransferase EpsI